MVLFRLAYTPAFQICCCRPWTKRLCLHDRAPRDPGLHAFGAVVGKLATGLVITAQAYKRERSAEVPARRSSCDR